MKYPIVFLCFAFGLSSLVQADDWPNFQGPTRNGISKEIGLKLSGWDRSPPSVLWKKELNEGFGGAAISRNEVFLVDRDLGERETWYLIRNDGVPKRLPCNHKLLNIKVGRI